MMNNMKNYLDTVTPRPIAKVGSVVVPYRIPDTIYELIDQTRYIDNVPRPKSYIERKQDVSIADEIALLSQIENSKNNPNGGWDAKRQRWYPHVSAEGGEKTIAYGLKLIDHKNSSAKRWADIVKRQGYLTDAQAIQARQEMVASYREGAKKIFDKKYGTGSFDKLDTGLQTAAIDIQYNGGLGNFPSFMEAAYNGDRYKARNETHRHTGGKSLGRNKIIQDYVDSTTPYIGKNYKLKYGGSIRRSLAAGGSIYIKPSHRGRLTELKARTGKSEAELYNDGNPAHKKMVVFARNARKWKH